MGFYVVIVSACQSNLVSVVDLVVCVICSSSNFLFIWDVWFGGQFGNTILQTNVLTNGLEDNGVDAFEVPVCSK